MDTEAFVEKARKVHGDAYLYEKTIHTGTKHCRVVITCPVHGDFEHRADSHLQGNGCKKCADDRRRMTTEDFIKKAVEVHGDRFDYSKVDYKGSHERVTIICPLHGEFTPLAYLHLQKRGCRACKYLNHPGGYTYDLFRENRELADSTGVFYIVQYDFEDESFLKIGITQHSAYVRHKSYWKNVTILIETPMKLEKAFHKEQTIINRLELQPFRYHPKNISAGVTECFTLDAKPFLF